jgi:parallel beta-helix repeat protein
MFPRSRLIRVVTFAGLAFSSLPLFAATINVTSADDSGPGTLRQALLDAASGACAQPCRIVIGDPDSEYGMAIDVASPLPDIVVSGTSIECNALACAISGARSGFRSGLRLIGVRDVAIQGLDIHSFEGHGIFVDGGGGHVIRSNQLGSNGLDGIAVRRSGGNTIEDNEIFHSRGNGIYLEYSSGNTLRGNYIGSTRFGGSQRATGNGAHGIHLHHSAGTQVEENVIHYNALHGIVIDGTAAGNSIVANSVGSNGLLGIDLGGDGPDANDPLDADDGPNRRQNSPVLQLEDADCTNASVTVTLESVPSTTFAVEFFTSAADDVFPQGTRLVGRTGLTTDASGHASATVVVPTAGGGTRLTATATSPAGDTSEFAKTVLLPEGCVDLAVTLDVPRLAPPSREVRAIARVTNESLQPSEERGARISFPEGTVIRPRFGALCVSERPHQIRCTLPSLRGGFPQPPDESFVFMDVTLPKAIGSYTATAALDPDPLDGNASNDTAIAPFEITSSPDLAVILPVVHAPIVPADPGGVIPFEVTIANTGITAAEDAVFRLDVDPPVFVGLASYGYDWICTSTPTGVECRNPSFGGAPYTGFNKLLFEIHAPDSGTIPSLRVDLRVTTTSDDFDPTNDAASTTRPVYLARFVTTTLDAGEGTLRQALLDAHALDCEAHGCKIMFRIPADEAVNGLFTIRPDTPLPPITKAGLIVDGFSQARFTGNTNPEGPEIEINGSHAGDGNGLEIRAAGTSVRSEVRHVVLNGWPGNGMLFAASDGGDTNGSGIAASFVGTDPTGTFAVPNGANGIETIGDASASVSSGREFCRASDDPGCELMIVSGNVGNGIRSRGRSIGVYSARIGTARHLDRPLPNGRSGIRIDASDSGVIQTTRLAYNGDDGLELHGNVNLYLLGNSFEGNADLGVDVNGDGVTPNDVPDLDGTQNYPEILGAVWDEATNTTAVTLSIPGYATPGFPFRVEVRLFRSSEPDARGVGQGVEEIIAGYVSNPPAGPFTMTVPGDRTGEWLTAMATLIELPGYDGPSQVRSLSEFGPAFRARP